MRPERERAGTASATDGRGGKEARVEESHSQEEGVAEKRARTEKSGMAERLNHHCHYTRSDT